MMDVAPCCLGACPDVLAMTVQQGLATFPWVAPWLFEDEGEVGCWMMSGHSPSIGLLGIAEPASNGR